MKFLFIPAKSKSKVNKEKIIDLSRKLPKNLAIAYSIQYKDIAKEVKEILAKSHNINSLVQILGCSKPKFPKQTQAVLLIGSGKFHAIALGFETGLPIYMLRKDSIEKISEQDVNKLEKAHKASYLRFLNANKIGILISLKPGQYKFKKVLELKRKIKDKKSYLFLANNINSAEFDNYKIDSWINTACPRLDMDVRVVNSSSLDIRNGENSLESYYYCCRNKQGKQGSKS